MRVTLALALVAALAIPPAAAAVQLPPGFVDETIVTGLREPTTFAFLPDGRILVGEQRTGSIRLIVNGALAATDPVHTLFDVIANEYENGLQSLAIDPRWPDRPYIYVMYSRTGQAMRLVRYRAFGDVRSPLGQFLFLGEPMLLLDPIPDARSYHNGGGLRFGPDRMLYVSTGDDGAYCTAQDSTSLLGAILRLNVVELPDGPGGPTQVPRSWIDPGENPLVTNNPNARLVWAYGFRNPWRFHIDSATGLLYVGDVGEGSWEEINEVRPGNNHGFPFREGPIVQGVPWCSEPGGAGTAKYVAPVALVGHSDQGSAILTAGVFRSPPGVTNPWPADYGGALFFSDHFSGVLHRLKRVNGQWQNAPVPSQPDSIHWATGLMLPSDFAIGPDGQLWWLSLRDPFYTPGSGALHRIRKVGVPIDVTPQPRTMRLVVAPNPFRSTTDLQLHVESASPVRLEIFDTSGRRVRRLLDDTFATGVAQVHWDGRDDASQDLPAGVYLARCVVGGRSAVTRIFKVR